MDKVDDWESQIERLWQTSDELSDDELRAAVDELANASPYEDGTADFERAGAWDSTGRSDLAIPLYEKALEAGLGPDRRRRAVIQLASSLRNEGRVDESIGLLEHERDHGSDELDDAVIAFLALARASAGEEKVALSLALEALANHLPRYRISVSNYAKHLIDPTFFDT